MIGYDLGSSLLLNKRAFNYICLTDTSAMPIWIFQMHQARGQVIIKAFDHRGVLLAIGFYKSLSQSLGGFQSIGIINALQASFNRIGEGFISGKFVHQIAHLMSNTTPAIGQGKALGNGFFKTSGSIADDKQGMSQPTVF